MLALYLTISDVFRVPSTFQAHDVWLSFCIGNPSFCTISLEMKHHMAPLSINAFAPIIFTSCFQIKIGRWIELDFNPEIIQELAWRRKVVLVHLPPLKRHLMIRERNMGCSFYSQNSSRFVPFLSCRGSSARGFPCLSKDVLKADLKV